MVSLQAWSFALRATTPHVAFGYDPTRRSVFYITNDHLTLIVFKKLTPTFFFINACKPEDYKETDKYFVLFTQNSVGNMVISTPGENRWEANRHLATLNTRSAV